MSLIFQKSIFFKCWRLSFHFIHFENAIKVIKFIFITFFQASAKKSEDIKNRNSSLLIIIDAWIKIKTKTSIDARKNLSTFNSILKQPSRTLFSEDSQHKKNSYCNKINDFNFFYSQIADAWLCCCCCCCALWKIMKNERNSFTFVFFTVKTWTRSVSVCRQ